MVTAGAPGVLGRFVWYELLTSDVEGGVAFYTDVVGWERTAWPTGGGDQYHGWNVGGQALAGAMALPEDARKAGAPPHWLAYVGTPDVDRTTADASRRGATVYVQPTDIPQIGRFAVLADPQGASFALFAPGGEHPGMVAPSGPVSWHELATTDLDAAFDFYSTLFRWQKADAHDMGPLGTYQMFGRGAAPLGAMFKKTADMPGPPHWMLYFQAGDIAATLEKVKARGGQALVGPMEVPGGDLIAQCLDPQGAAFALHQTK